MFNNTAKILPYVSSGTQGSGIILPQSDKVLCLQILNKKIERAKSHIAHLTHQLPHRNTHGGKRLRTRKISIQNQINVSAERLGLLQMAKATFSKVRLLKTTHKVDSQIWANLRRNSSHYFWRC